MNIRKILLIASMALAWSAYAVPAAVQASEHDEWWKVTTNDAEEVIGEHTVGQTTDNGETIEFTGNLTKTSATGLTTGPCLVHATARIWNHKPSFATVTATAEFMSLQVTTPCPTNVPNCNVEEGSTKGFPWPVDIAGNTAIDVTGANFLTKFAGAGCAGAGVPSAFEATGTLTGNIGNVGETVCIVFDKSPHMTIHPIPSINIPITIDGVICARDVTLKPA